MSADPTHVLDLVEAIQFARASEARRDAATARQQLAELEHAEAVRRARAVFERLRGVYGEDFDGFTADRAVARKPPALRSVAAEPAAG